MGAGLSRARAREALIAETLKLEESRFRQTLDRGLGCSTRRRRGLPEGGRCRARPRSSSTTPTAFRSTSPRTRCARAGIKVDLAGFDAAMARSHAALAPPARQPCDAEGQPGRSRLFPLRLLAPQGPEPRDIEAIEAEVNAQIRSNEPVGTRLMTPDEAIAAGAMALFGEKYGDEVRVLSMGRADEADYSVELCGGTHVRALGDIQLLKIVSRERGLLGRPPDRGADRRGGAALADASARRSFARRRPRSNPRPTRCRRGSPPDRRTPPARARARRGEEGAGDGRRLGKGRRTGARAGQRAQFPRPGGGRVRPQGLAGRS
jgi:hypothetical protein